MRSIFLVATLAALAWARPETYKETEEFQYARSSSDEGSKSGYYGAQRGNVAGNYEKAHNMDSLAQHQMSGAINQVQGELGDISKTRAGSVYTAANSAGMYGSGHHYDLSNLHGRNFGESSSSDSSHSSMSSAYNQHLSNQHSSLSQGSGYSGSHLGSTSHLGNLHAADDYGSSLAGSNSHSSGYHSASGYNSQSGYNSHGIYDSSLTGQTGTYGTSDQYRPPVIVTPVRIVTRPGGQIAIPVYGQAGYDAHRLSSSFDQSSSNRYTAAQTAASSFDQNAINSEAEVLNSNQHHIASVPVSNGKQYSSSYNYHKAWERHSETTDAPIVPTANPLSVNSELYEDAQGTSGSDLQQANSYSGSAHNSANRFNSFTKSGSSQSNHRSGYRSQSDANSNAYTQGTYGSHSGLATLVDSQPKSYQSSYSYHKSWEKQGDPYVIVPGTTGEASQNIVSSNTKTGASSQRYGSHQHYSQGSAVDCDSLCRYRRSTRSAAYYQQDQEDFGQQAQASWDQNLSQQTQQSQHFFDQQSQSANLEDLGQQTQDLGQQTQQSWSDLQQQSQSEKLEDLGQQTQDLGQQTQQSWDNFQQQSQSENLEDLGQQTQDLGQQSLDTFAQQNQFNAEESGQQQEGKWHDLSQKFESNLEDFGQQTQQSWNNFEQQASRQNLENVGQQTQGQWHNVEPDNNDQRSQHSFDNLDNLGQQTQQTWSGFSNIEQQTKPQKPEELEQQSHNKWDDLSNLGQQAQTQWDTINTINKTRHTDTNTEQQTQTHFESVDQVKPNREHAGDKPKNPAVNNPDDLAFWGLTNEQKREHNHYYHQQNDNNYNSNSNLQGYGVNRGPHSNNDKSQTTHNNPLQSIWDKLDNMEEQSEHSSNETQQNIEYQSSQHSYGQESTYHHESNWEKGQSFQHWNQQETHYSGYQPPVVFNTTIDKPRMDQSPKTPIPEKPKDDDDDDETPEEPESPDVGRGDIGAEAESKTTPKTTTNLLTYVTQTKPEKSPEEIEALSLSRGTEEDTTKVDSLSVLSISQQKWLEEQRNRAVEELYQGSVSKSSSTTTPRSVVNKNTTPNVRTGSQPREIQEHENTQQSEGKENNKFNLQNTIQQNHDVDQQNVLQFHNFGPHSQTFDQQNTGQQLEDFGQETQDLSQHNLQQFHQLGQNNEKINQQNTEHKLEDFGQQTQDLSQQNLQQFHHLGQNSEKIDQQNTEQQFEDFGQQTQDLSQQNLQQFHHLGQNSENMEQQNTEQQFEDFGQQTQDLNQQNLQFTNLEHHSHNSPQQAREFQSHSNTQLVQEEEITPVRDHGSLSHPKQEVEIVPPVVTTTEKPGFWKSVGSKLTSAKDSVASWFKRS